MMGSIKSSAQQDDLGTESVLSFGYTFVLALSLVCVATLSTGLCLGHFDTSSGPRPIPLIGNVGTLLRLRADLDAELIRIREKWGKSCKLKFGNTPVLIINDPRTAKELLNEVCCTDLTHPDLDTDVTLAAERYIFFSTRTKRISKRALAFQADHYTCRAGFPFPA